MTVITLTEATKMLNAAGIRFSKKKVGDLIQRQILPIGFLYNISKTGRRTFIIEREKLEAYIDGASSYKETMIAN